jgi:hypothetical protein
MNKVNSFISALALSLVAVTLANQSAAAGNYRASFTFGNERSTSGETNGPVPYGFYYFDLGAKREPFLVNDNGTVVSYVEHTSGPTPYVRWIKGVETTLGGARFVTPNSILADDSVVGTVNQFVGLSWAGRWPADSGTPKALALPFTIPAGYDVQSEAYFMTDDGMWIGRYDLIRSGFSSPSQRTFFRAFLDGRPPEIVTVDDYSSSGQFTNFDYANNSGNMIAEFFRESDPFNSSHAPYYGYNQDNAVSLPFPSNQRSAVNSRGQGSLTQWISGVADYPYGFWDRADPHTVRYLGTLVRSLYGTTNGSDPNFKYARINEPAKAGDQLWLTGRTEMWFQRNPGKIPVDLQRIGTDRLLPISSGLTGLGLSNVSPNGRYFVGLAQDTTGTNHGVLLIRFDLNIVVDANRDGQLASTPGDNSDQTSASQPFQFWVNDDNDQNKLYTYADQLPGFIQAPASLIPDALAVQEQEQDDLAESATSDQNWNNSVIDCERDLEDFARLWIYTSGLNDSFRNGQLSLGLKWTDVSSGNPAIRLFKHAEADGGTKYLTDPATAHQQIDQTGPGYGLALGTGLVEGSTPFVLPQSVFANLSDSAPKTYLLFEGCKAGKGQLKFVILKPKGDGTYNTIGEGPGVWMDLKEPHEFIERWSCGDGDRGDVQPVVRENSNSASPAWGSPATDEEKDYILYVHGYNMKEFEKQRWIETTFKRLYWLGFKGRVGGFTWPCSQSAPPYDESEEKSWQSATQLMNLLSSLKAAGYRVHVLAHSQGNVVTGEALRQWKAAGNTSPLVSTYVASQAAIAAHCYASNVLLIPDFEDSSSDDHTPNVYLNYPPTSAPYLGVTAMQGAAGRYANFYNISDYALTGNSPTHPGWEIDQRWKPNQGFTYNSVDGFLESTATGFTTLTIPNDRFRIFCYGAEARSKALGTMPTGGAFTSFTNLQSSLSYGSEHIYHSAQFRSYYAARYQYWTTLLTNLGLQPLLQ